MAKEIITREDAKTKGLTRYFPVVSCKRGHICEWFVTSKGCVECDRLLKADPARRAKDREWRERHAAELLEYHQRYRAENVERMRALQKRWLENNAERQRLKRLENAEVLRRKTREWQLRNPERSRLYTRKRRAAKLRAGGSHTIDDIHRLLVKQNFKCISCLCSIRGRYDVDHRIPLSKGGSDDISNIDLLCEHCNSRKYNKDPLTWARENGRLV